MPTSRRCSEDVVFEHTVRHFGIGKKERHKIILEKGTALGAVVSDASVVKLEAQMRDKHPGILTSTDEGTTVQGKLQSILTSTRVRSR